MPYLIDGSNLMGTLPGYRRAHMGDQDRLVRRILATPDVRKRGLALVFDGSPSYGEDRRMLSSKFRVHWSGPRMDGDTLLRHFMDKAPPNRYILVSDDREVREYARAMGVKNISCAQFAKLLVSEQSAAKDPVRRPFEKDPPKGLSPEEQRDWLEWFEGDAEDP